MVTSAFIKLWDQVVGAVAWNPREGYATFEYDKNFNLNAYPVAPIRMPAKRIYAFPELRNSAAFKGLPGLLADSLPDRYGNDLINNWLMQNGRTAQSLNPVELLCFIGKRGMGALEFEPSTSPESHTDSIELESLITYTRQLLHAKENQLLHTPDHMRDVMLEVLKMGTSAGGARPKAVIAYNESTGDIRSGQVLPGDGFDHFILKFDGVSDAQFGAAAGYGRVEMAYYDMALAAGINMMESKLIVEGERAHFLTKRYDRSGNQKIHTQTLCAIQHYDFNLTTAYSYEQVFETMRLLHLDYNSAEQMFRRMVFNVVARNCDDHTKNFSFLMPQNGQWQLAPAYDVCHAYRPGSEWVSHHNLSINGKRLNIAKADLLSVAAQNSIKQPDKIIDVCLSVINNWKKYARQYDVDNKLINAIDKTLVKRL